MRKTILIWLSFLSVIGIALYLAQVEAHAHAQVYPHVHPHEHVAISEDALAAILWLSINVAAFTWAWRAGRKNRRVKK